MKKYFLFILIGLNCVLAFNHAGKAAIESKGTFSRSSGNYVSPALHIPNAEMEIFTVKAGAASQANHSGKKLFDDSESRLRYSLTYDYCRYQNCGPILQLYAKSYLSHIYPSHNFW